MKCKFNIITFGCQMNFRDSLWLGRILEEKGFEPAGEDEADIVVLNTCSVREKPQLKIESCIRRLEQGKKPERRIAILGCVAQQEGEALFALSPQICLVVGGDKIAQTPDALLRIVAGEAEKIKLLDFDSQYRERQYDPGHYAQAAINIMQGCDNFCSYCIVPYTRGRQKSRQMAEILRECGRRLDEGVIEITLLGQNVNAWGKDLGNGADFADLLNEIAGMGVRRLRYVSPHPADMDMKSIEMLARWENICPRLHLPLQSGSDNILKKMRRSYGAEDFLRLVGLIGEARPGIALSTDLIVGFPGETEADFEATLNVMRQARFMASYSFCYSDRPGTRASLMPDKIPSDIKHDRLERLQALQEEMGQAWLKGRVGEYVEVLLESPSPRPVEGKISWQGKDPFGAAINVPLDGERDYAGEVVKVKIVASKKHSLIGEAASACCPPSQE